MFSQNATGVAGGRTFRIGDSTITIGGTLARSDVAKLKRLIVDAERYFQTAGLEDDPYAEFYQTEGFWDDFAQGASAVRDVANNPAVAGLAAATGPYGAAVLAAANGVPAAIDVMKQAGVLPEHATQVAQMHHPDPKVRDAANKRNAAIKTAADKGDRRAAAILAGLRAAHAMHLTAQLAECQAALAAAQERLAMYGDPNAYNLGSGYGGPMAAPGLGAARSAPAWGTTSGPAVNLPPSLTAALNRALARVRMAPSPSFRVRPLHGRA